MLKHLYLSFCVKLECLPSSIGDLRLQSLDLEGCIFLGDLPDSIYNMSTLEIIEAALAFEVEDEVEKLRESLNLQGSFELDGGRSDLWIQIAELERTPAMS
jgi:aquaporin TIP